MTSVKSGSLFFWLLWGISCSGAKNTLVVPTTVDHPSNHDSSNQDSNKVESSLPSKLVLGGKSVVEVASPTPNPTEVATPTATPTPVATAGGVSNVTAAGVTASVRSSISLHQMLPQRVEISLSPQNPNVPVTLTLSPIAKLGPVEFSYEDESGASISSVNVTGSQKVYLKAFAKGTITGMLAASTLTAPGEYSGSTKLVLSNNGSNLEVPIAFNVGKAVLIRTLDVATTEPFLAAKSIVIPAGSIPIVANPVGKRNVKQFHLGGGNPFRHQVGNADNELTPLGGGYCPISTDGKKIMELNSAAPNLSLEGCLPCPTNTTSPITATFYDHQASSNFPAPGGGGYNLTCMPAN
jgi:hypothetical protein